MADYTVYKSISVLADVTVSQITGGATVISPTTPGASTASNANIVVTPNTITSSDLAPGYVADARIIEIISPVDNSASANVYPDVELTFVNGGESLKSTLLIDGSFLTNMFARKKVTHGSRQIVLGFSVRELLLWNMAHPNRQDPLHKGNMPMSMTGIKVTKGLNVEVTSTNGWGNNGAVQVPLRVIVKGEKYLASDLVPFANAYDGTIKLNYPGVPEFNAFHVINGPVSAATWASLPGGVNQVGTVKVFRNLNYAYNALATGTSTPFVFSQITNVGGNQNNVKDTAHDLGNDFTIDKNMFLWQHLGFRIPSGQAYVGFKVGNQVVPQDSMFGAAVSYGVNDYQYGDADPQGAAGTYYAMSEADTLAQMMVYGNAVAPFIATVGTVSYAANTASVAKSGILVKA